MVQENEKPKKLNISMADIEQQYGWLVNWNGFLWYISDHARIHITDSTSCTLEIVSRAHEYHVLSAIRNYTPRSLNQEIENSLDSGLKQKIEESWRNKDLVIRLFYSAMQEKRWFKDAFLNLTAEDTGTWFTDTFAMKLKESPTIPEIEEEYQNAFPLPKQIYKLARAGEYHCLRPSIQKGRIIVSDHILLLFQTKNTAECISIIITKLIIINNSVLWSGSYRAVWKDGFCKLKYADDYRFRMDCAADSLKIIPSTYSTKIQTANENHIRKNLNNNCMELCMFCSLMDNLAKEQGDRIGEKRIVAETTWYVRGHWRTLKSGKRVYVHPHTKGITRREET